ncbi:N-6 DNA methylase [Achromobacter xylosoxidans]|uniref:N-6 DNA methylase n=1 Tax=Alcaligenes xylosoxydans xylosoxydans TaxID=85698 RepID=UPI0010605BD1|nr:N-6 DNA methylase [Achromobacter xylosoxidans]
MDYTTLQKNIKELVSKSKMITTERKAIGVMLCHAYNFALTTTVQYGSRQFPHCSKITEPFVYEPKSDAEIELLVKCLTSFVSLYKNSEPFEDVLTNIYAEHLDFKLGQHMTPPDLSRLLFQIIDSSDGIESHLKTNNTFSIYDPTSGTGSLAMGALQGIYKKYGKEVLSRIDVFLCDIDFKMCIASLVNLELSSLSHQLDYNQLTVFNQNSLLDFEEKNKFVEIIPNFLKHRKVRKLYDFEVKEDKELETA